MGLSAIRRHKRRLAAAEGVSIAEAPEAVVEASDESDESQTETTEDVEGAPVPSESPEVTETPSEAAPVLPEGLNRNSKTAEWREYAHSVPEAVPFNIDEASRDTIADYFLGK